MREFRKLANIGSLFLLLSGPLMGGESQTFRSGPDRVALIELYSSEGCSSCPAAENWLNRLENQRGLWTRFVPVAFHVDYWDGLGWKDVFARREFTERQRSYASLWNSPSVYTPGMVWNGKEWRNWARAETLPESGLEKPGVLEAIRDISGSIEVRFKPQGEWSGGTAHTVLLGSGLKSDVKSGENSGRTLAYEFVALDEGSASLARNSQGEWTAKIPSLQGEAARLSVAVWVESSDRQEPVQAVGGWLESKATN